MPWLFSGTRQHLLPRTDIRPTAAARVAALLLLQVAAYQGWAGQEATPESRARLKAALLSAESLADPFDGQEWLTDMSARLGRQVPDSETRIRILKTVHREATRSELPPEMVLAVIDSRAHLTPTRYQVPVPGA